MYRAKRFTVPTIRENNYIFGEVALAATIKDIKDRTGLSLATISKYLNGGNLLPENREKIERAIKELHYEVNEMARGLVTSQSRVIGIVVFNIANVFTCTVLRYLGQRIREAGYAAMICDSQDDERMEADNIRFLLGKKVDGLIVIPVAQTSEFLDPAVRAGIPVVLLDRSLPDRRFDSVKINNAEASYQAVDLLYSYGHRRIAVIGSDSEITGRERLEGCLRLLRDRGTELPDRYLKLGRHSMEHGYRSMKELLALADPPTAVFLGNFEIILGAVMAVNESDRSCPGDISLIGFDDLIISNLSNPRLTLVVQPLEGIASAAAELLFRRLEQEKTLPADKDADQDRERQCVELVLPARITEGDSVARRIEEGGDRND